VRAKIERSVGSQDVKHIIEKENRNIIRIGTVICNRIELFKYIHIYIYIYIYIYIEV